MLAISLVVLSLPDENDELSCTSDTKIRQKTLQLGRERRTADAEPGSSRLPLSTGGRINVDGSLLTSKGELQIPIAAACLHSYMSLTITAVREAYAWRMFIVMVTFVGSAELPVWSSLPSL